MKLSLVIAAALSALLYAIIKHFAPDFPISADDFLKLLVLVLSWFGVTVIEEQTRAFFVRKGFTAFKK